MSETSASHKRHRFAPAIIAHAIWLYLRFSLSLRAVEELLLERGVEVSYETRRRWVAKFGPLIARGLRRRRARPGRVWHLDEVQVAIRGRRFGSGERSMRRASCSRRFCSRDGTGRPPRGCYAVCSRPSVEHRSGSSSTSWPRRPRQSGRSRPASSTVSTRPSTAAPRTATCRSDRASG